MITRLTLLSWKPGAIDRDKDELRKQIDALTLAAAPSRGAIVASPVPPSKHGGDIAWRLAFDSPREHDALLGRSEWRSAAEALENSSVVEHIDRVSAETVSHVDRWPEQTGGIYRSLVISPMEILSPQLRNQLEVDLLGMPKKIGTIRRWNLARVVESAGARQWSHLWEQEFSDIDGFRGEYLQHPYHWGYLDRWFDCENPDRKMDSRYCTGFCFTDKPVLATTA